MKKNEKPGALRRIFRRQEDYLRLFFHIFIFYLIFLFIYLLIFDFQPQFFFWLRKSNSLRNSPQRKAIIELRTGVAVTSCFMSLNAASCSHCHVQHVSVHFTLRSGSQIVGRLGRNFAK